ncbi:MAG: 2-C-methyl-D-erythritol 2,4-cyclodiphosphate synthase [Gemmatimonadetes bacterium]|nr:2-C-methyl-D-erythritol 2,4-cyclodiphosphate synthase [Gemmatimonadota bacterium]
MRIGFGYDSHRFDPSRPLILGGIRIPAASGLAGHSDADAVAHAIIDALLGAAAAGDIGTHFPPDDPRWKDADSMHLLEQAVRVLGGRDYRVVNVDVTVVCERPRIGSHARAMQERLAKAMGLRATQVSIKAKTNEGLGWIGAAEGLAACAVALIEEGGAADGAGGGPPGPGRTLAG